MPTVASNIGQWNDSYDWGEAGDEWSRQWGGPDVQWYGSLLWRIQAFLPGAETVLEIAPGYGRWTQYLKNHCQRLAVVDLSEKCIEACKQRFADCDHIDYHVNDGTSLEMIADHSIDFVFSFDSLVHVEQEVIGAYLGQLASKLRPDGVGFIHHSNLAECLGQHRWLRSTRVGRKVARTLGLIEKYDHWRGRSMSAQRFAEHAEAAGLVCIAQEKIPWHGNPQPIDCISTFTPRGSRWARPNRVHFNRGFLAEARMLRELATLYGCGSFRMAARPQHGREQPIQA